MSVLAPEQDAAYLAAVELQQKLTGDRHGDVSVIASALLAFHRDRLTVPEEVEKRAKFLDEAAVYFEKRPTGGEDSAYWSNIYNAENCEQAATLIRHQAARIAELRGKKSADELEQRLWSIIDRDGLNNVPSDICGAVDRLCRLAAQVEAMRDALTYADGCFEAALAEGWVEAIESGNVEAIQEWWRRRLSFARDKFPAALAALKENPDADKT